MGKIRRSSAGDRGEPPGGKGEGRLPAAGQIPAGNNAALLPMFLKMEMDVATHEHVLFVFFSSTGDRYNSMKCNNIGKKLVFVSFPPSSFLLG